MSPRKKVENDLYISLLGFFYNKPGYGYELYRFIAKETVFFQIWFLKRSKFYALLDRLHAEEYLSCDLVSGGQYPDRKLFTITETGSERIRLFSSSPVKRGREMRQEFLAKLFICRNYLPNLESELVTSQIQLCEKMLEGIESSVISEGDDFLRLMIGYRKNQILGMIEWLRTI